MMCTCAVYSPQQVSSFRHITSLYNFTLLLHSSSSVYFNTFFLVFFRLTRCHDYHTSTAVITLPDHVVSLSHDHDQRDGEIGEDSAQHQIPINLFRLEKFSEQISSILHSSSTSIHLSWIIPCPFFAN